jgi:hypothetical protein
MKVNLTIGLWLRYLSGRLSLEQIFKGHNEPLFNATPGLLSMSKKDWDEITRKLLKQYLKLSFKRTKFQGLNQKH